MCTYGGDSVPIVTSVVSPPFNDVTIALKLTDSDSKGLTISATQGASSFVNGGSTQGVLSFSCDASNIGTRLAYEITGTDKDAYQTRYPDLIVVAKSKGERDALRDDHLKMNPGTTPTKMIIDGYCP